jgi:hypothetical protein
MSIRVFLGQKLGEVPMSTSVNVNEPPSPQDQTRRLAEEWTRAAIGLLIAGGLVCLVAGMIYLNSLVSPAQLQDLGQVVGP